jgi:hypothetical protein
MAQSNRSAASYVAESRNTKPLSNAMFNWAKANMSKLKNPTAAQKKIFAKYKSMVKAGNTPANPKPKPAPSKPAASKPSSSNSNGRSRFFQSSSGTRGPSRPSNSPGPAVVKQGSRTGASVDPRERQLRKNRQEALRSGGSSSAGRRNIARQVAEQSGSAKRNQRQVEARRRRARQEGAMRNRRMMLSNKYNKD